MPTVVSPAPRTHVGRPAATAGSTLGALGVVFGDIGTSQYKRPFVARWRNAASPVGYFQLPDRRTITLGWQIRL